MNQPKPKGGKRLGAGAKKGVRLAPVTRERIRGAMILRHMEDVALGYKAAQPHQVTAGLGILRFVLPTLQATDLTSGGEPIQVERVVFGQKPK